MRGIKRYELTGETGMWCKFFQQTFRSYQRCCEAEQQRRRYYYAGKGEPWQEEKLAIENWLNSEQFEWLCLLFKLNSAKIKGLFLSQQERRSI